MKGIFNIHSIFLILVSLALYVFDAKETTIGMLILYGIHLILLGFAFNKVASKPINYLRPFFILLLGCTIVNFQGIIDYDLFGYPNYFNRLGLGKYVNRCLYLAVIAQTALALGYINYKPAFKRNYDFSKMRFINWRWLSILVVASFILFVISIDINAFLFGYEGSGAYDREGGTLSMYSEVLLTTLLVIHISTSSLRLRLSDERPSLKKYLKSLGIPFCIVFTVYLFLRLLSGDRGPVMYNSAILFFGFVYASGVRVSIKWAVILIIGCAFIVSLIGIARQQSTTLSFIDKMSVANTTFNASEKESIIPVTSELAGSGNIAAIALRATQDKGSLEYGYGKYEISAILFRVPFLSRLILTLYPEANLSELSTSELFTKEVLGPNYTYGLGTSAVGEAYLDLHLVGVIFVFFLFGMFFKAADVCIINRKICSPYLYTIFLYMSGYAIYIGRASFAYILGGAVSVVIIQYLIGLTRIQNGYQR